MPVETHPIASPALLTILMLTCVPQVSGQTQPERPAGLVRTDIVGGETERSDTGQDVGANPCAYVALLSKEAGMPGTEEDDPKRDNYGYIVVGDECH